LPTDGSPAVRTPGPGSAFAGAALIVALDQITKLAVRGAMHAGQSMTLIPGALYLTYVRNTGAAFGLLPDRQVLFMAASLAIISLLSWLLVTHRLHSLLARIACVFALGGAAGNLIDRLMVGRVTDFLDVRIWPVFNVADSAIVFGACLLVLSVFMAPTVRRRVAETTGHHGPAEEPGSSATGTG
jgi:signal peptidase II